MAITPETFAQSNKALVETLVTVANTALAAAEQIVTLNTQTARSIAQDSAAVTKAVLDAKSPQDLAAIQANLAQPSMEKAMAYSRTLYEIAAQAQQAFAQHVSKTK